MKVEHKSRAHALLSASGSHRWMNCTPSAVLEDKEPNKSSVYADEGTLAHEFSEVLLKKELGLISTSEYDEAYDRITSHKLYSQEMDYYVQVFADYVLERHYSEPSYPVFLEQKLSLEKYIADGFGTVDSVKLGSKSIEIIDLKYGKGVAVSAVENSQLKLYALAALNAYSFMLEDVEDVIMTIVQPRLDSISSYTISKEELLFFGDSTVKQKAELATNGAGDLNPGSWCQFCRVQHKCRALSELANDTASDDFAEVQYTMTDDEIIHAYSKIDFIVSYLKSVKSYVFNQAMNGKKWDGYKLVEAKSNRIFKDSNLVAKELIEEHLISPDSIYNRKIKSFTELKKEIGSELFKSVVEPNLIKPQGKPTLVVESDKRPEYSSIDSDFGGVDVDSDDDFDF